MLAFIGSTSIAQTPFPVSDSIDEHNFMPYDLYYYIDPTNTLTFDEIAASHFTDQIRQHPDYQNKDFRSNASYWIRLPIHHNPGSEKVWILEFYDQTIDHIEAYVPQSDGTYKVEEFGDSRPFLDRTFLHKNFEIVLSMPSDTVMYYYFKVQSHDF